MVSTFHSCELKSKEDLREMVFEVANKVAVITGGASGLGLRYAKELLQNGLGGVTLVDMDVTTGRKAEEELNNTFGKGKALFVKTDVTKHDEFEEAFKATLAKFKNVDILINNAGLMNDLIWEKEVAVNMNGAIHGMFLGFENYLKNFKQGDEAVIVNISSVVGLNCQGYMPVYCATKAAMFAMSKAWGTPTHYKRTGVRVVALCPGATNTPLLDMKEKFWSPDYEQTLFGDEVDLKRQGIDVISQELVRIIKLAQNGTIWVVEEDEPAYEYIVPDRKSFKNNVLTDE